jgi:predicted alpha/beta superfamily hydrolase
VNGPPSLRSSRARGQVEILSDLRFPGGTGCTLRIYYPFSYRAEPARRFPVLYLHDGQNVFDHPASEVYPSWGVNTALDRLIERRGVEPWLVVALDHRGAERVGDYSPWLDPRVPIAPGGAAHAAFVADELVPFIDRNLRTLPAPEHRAVGGSSLGGLIALYLGWSRPDVFRRVLALSPSVMWGERQLARFWSLRGPPSRIYLDVGSRELFDAGSFQLDYGIEVRDFVAHLRMLGHRDDELRFALDPQGQHTEADWRRRLPAALRWLLA